MVRRRSCAVSNYEAPMPPSFETRAYALLRTRSVNKRSYALTAASPGTAAKPALWA
jgi:hypothetical protein